MAVFKARGLVIFRGLKWLQFSRLFQPIQYGTTGFGILAGAGAGFAKNGRGRVSTGAGSGLGKLQPDKILPSFFGKSPFVPVLSSSLEDRRPNH